MRAMVTNVACRWRRLFGGLGVIAAVVIFAAACGAGTSGAPAAGRTASTGTTVRITTRKSLFDKRTLTAPAGAITVKVDNKDKGIPHNIHFFKGTDASGVSVGMTPMTQGPDTQILTMTLQPGTYFYQCDMHPAANGTLTVTP